MGAPLVLVLDGIQDPGNAGAILRAAEAFGATGVVFLKGTVSPYNPKAVRASAGSVFRMPLVTGLDAAALRDTLGAHAVDVVCGHAHGFPQRRGCGPDPRRARILIGSEGRGLGEATSGRSGRRAHPRRPESNRSTRPWPPGCSSTKRAGRGKAHEPVRYHSARCRLATPSTRRVRSPTACVPTAGRILPDRSTSSGRASRCAHRSSAATWGPSFFGGRPAWEKRRWRD